MPVSYVSAKGAVILLQRLELPDFFRVPFLPRVVVALEKRLRHVIAIILRVVAALVIIEVVLQPLQARLVLVRFLRFRDRAEQRRHRRKVHRTAHAAESARVGDRPVGAGAAALEFHRCVHHVVGHVHPRIARGQEAHQHRAGDRGVRIRGIGRVPPAAPPVFFLRGGGATDGQVERLRDAAHRLVPLPEQRFIHHAVRLG